MAQKVITTLVSDLSGKELAEGEARTVLFGLDGVEYEIDLSTEEAGELTATLTEYVANGRRVGGRRRTRGATVNGSPASRTKTDPEQLRKIREWARDNGFKVSDKGRIPQEVTDAYEKAHA